MPKLVVALKGLVSQEAGAAVVEYGLLIGLIAAIAIAALLTLQTTISDLYTSINSAL